MCRYAFYLSIALLTFGIGVFATIEFNKQSFEKDSIKPQTKETKIERTQSFVEEAKEETPKQKVKFQCKDKILLSVWNFLLEQNDFGNLANSVADEGISNCSEIFQINEFIDLNNDGVKEVIVRGKNSLVNSTTGNYGTWICQKVGHSYKVIFEESAEECKVKKSVTNGYRDIFIRGHASCCSSYLSTYKFHDGKYEESKCLF